jgi:DDE superfamily endonuclease
MELYLFWIVDGEDFYSRKGRYGLAGLIVCDDRKRIRYVYSGWAGCAHDTRVFKNSLLALQPERFFSGDEYLLADSGYTPSRHIIPVFKKPPRGSLTKKETRFNSRLSSIRVRVEHCIGILKGRFQSLKGLRIVLRRDKDIKRAVYWIRACCVLHNFLLKEEECSKWLDEEMGDDEDRTPPEASGQPSSRGESEG